MLPDCPSSSSLRPGSCSPSYPSASRSSSSSQFQANCYGASIFGLFSAWQMTCLHLYCSAREIIAVGQCTRVCVRVCVGPETFPVLLLYVVFFFFNSSFFLVGVLNYNYVQISYFGTRQQLVGAQGCVFTWPKMNSARYDQVVEDQRCKSVSLGALMDLAITRLLRSK